MSTVVETAAPVSLTEGAKKEVKKLMSQQELGSDFGLRLGVEGGGCSGMRLTASVFLCTKHMVYI
jgi:iron-sulfur cluster assembly protein